MVVNSQTLKDLTKKKQMSDLLHEEIDELFDKLHNEYIMNMKAPMYDIAGPGYVNEEFIEVLVMHLMEFYKIKSGFEGFAAFL